VWIVQGILLEAAEVAVVVAGVEVPMQYLGVREVWVLVLGLTNEMQVY